MKKCMSILILALCVSPCAWAAPDAFRQSKKDADVFIFVSFSMPSISLKQWLAQGQQIQAPVILQGLVDNSFQKTTKAILDLTQNQPYGMQIDPTAFERFHIKAVPAVVIADICENLSKECKSDYDVVSGNVSLLAAMETFARGKTTRAVKAQTIVNQLRGNSA